LAVLAVEIAAQSAQRKDETTREEMEQWFLFYRIGSNGRSLGVVEVIKNAALIVIHATDTVLLQTYLTVPLAGITPDPGVRKPLVKQCFMHC
ncbi:MAG: hypothetical protein JSW16_04675, partial [Dehalococcoidales bacterium]